MDMTAVIGVLIVGQLCAKPLYLLDSFWWVVQGLNL
jgi:hypothetical protein